MTRTPREEAEYRLAHFIDNAFYNDDNTLTPEIIKEMQKARNRCLKVLGFEQKPIYK